MQMNLGAFLEQRGISAYRLVKATEGQLAAATVYGLASKPVQRIDLATVSTMLEALSDLIGTEVAIQDVLEPVSATETQRRQAARARIAAPRRVGKFVGTAETMPEGDWSVTDQLAELRGRDL